MNARQPQQRARRRAGAAPAARWALLAALLGVIVGAAHGYEIGQRTLTFVDPERSNRQISTEIYYPADTPGENVPLATPDPPGFPVIACGHGFVITVDDYEFLWEGLVPNGYIVALPRTETGFSPSHLDLGLDLAFVCRALQAEGEQPASPFHEKVAPTSAVSGHSMGGGASFLAAASDPGITALFNLAAAETNPSAIGAAGQIEAPALLFAGSLDCVTPPAVHQQPMYEALASDCRTYVELLGASHCQFAEYNFLCSIGESGCPSPTISRAEQHALTLQLLLPWLDAFLLDDPQAWEAFQALLAGLPGIIVEQDCSVSGVAADRPGRSDHPVRLSVPALVLAGLPVDMQLQLSEPARIRVELLDLQGRLVQRILEEEVSAGTRVISWNGADRDGRPPAPGVYFVRARGAGAAATVRTVILR